MSSISSAGAASAAQVGSTSGHPGPGKRLEDDLSSFLSQQGVSADDQKEIQSEIKDGLSSASSGGKPDFSKLKDVVKQVLDKHGLSGDDFVSKLPSPSAHGGRAGGAGHAGGPPPGPPPSDASSADDTSSTDDSKNSWLQKIVSSLSQNTASSTQNSNATSIKTTLDSLDVNA